MFFRYELVAPLLLERVPEDGFTVDLGGPHDLRVTILSSDEGDETSPKGERKICIGQLSIEPNDKVRAVFEALAELRIPQGGLDPSDADWKWYLDDRGQLKPNVLVAAYMLPPGARSFISQVTAELSEGVRRTVKLLRWRWNLPGTHNPFVGRGYRWSFDGDVWRGVPGDTGVDVEMRQYLKVTEEVQSELQKILLDGSEEPLAQELFREAWALRGLNPRSALLIGVAALEIGTKDLISDLIPNSEWLMRTFLPPQWFACFRNICLAYPRGST